MRVIPLGLLSRLTKHIRRGGRRATRTGNPYFFLGSRPFREARLRSYVLREHQTGRPLGEILDDPYLQRYGNRRLVWKVVAQAETLAALEADVRAAINGYRPDLRLAGGSSEPTRAVP